MPLFLIDIHWERRSHQDGKPPSGTSTLSTAGRSLAEASRKATRKFNLQFGMHLRITRITEKQDPAGLFS